MEDDKTKNDNENVKEKEVDLKKTLEIMQKQLNEQKEKIDRLQAINQEKDEELKSKDKILAEEKVRMNNRLNSSLAVIDTIKNNLGFLGITNEIDTKEPIENLLRKASSEIINKFGIDYTLSDLNLETDFKNLVTIAKEKQLQDKLLNKDPAGNGNLVYEIEGSFEYKVLTRDLSRRS